MSPNETLILLLHQIQKGLFPITRHLQSVPYQRPDTCIFGAASIARILQDLQPLFSETDAPLASQVQQHIAQRYLPYHHPSRPGTFNFWQKAFPNGYLLHRLRHFRLPADIDDTALILSTGHFPPSHHLLVYQTAQEHTERARRAQGWPIRPTFYRSVPNQEWIYQTWFGVRMPLEFDVCALCNWMCWVVEQGFYGQSPSDEATTRFLLAVLHSPEWINQAPQVARHYGRPAWIAYYAARWILVCQKNGIILEVTPFQKLLLNQLTNDPTPDQLLLHIAHYKLGGDPRPWLEIPSPLWEIFPLFLGHMLAPFGTYWATKPWANLHWTSPANGLALQMEYTLWHQHAHVLHRSGG